MMQVTFSRSVIFGLLLALSPFVAFGQEAVIQVEFAEEEPVTDVVEVPQEKKDEKPKEEEEEAVVSTAAKPLPPKPPQYIRMSLVDGSIISGDLTIKEISVATEFGELVVPIANIVSLKPGLDSYPGLANNIRGLVEKLGGDDYQQREQAHKALEMMGPKIREELSKFAEVENVEQKRHVSQLIKTFEAALEEADEFEDNPTETAWIRDDQIVTTSFTIVGKVSPKTFQIESKYGPLNVALADLKLAERPTDIKETVRRTVKVEGTYIIQRDVKSSGLQVQKGDKISIVADGQLAMTPWGSRSFSTPQGGSNFGTYKSGIFGGTLLGKIGKSGEEIKLGTRTTFTAKQTGVLYFGIAMQASYSGTNYQFPGNYNVRIKVTPQ